MWRNGLKTDDANDMLYAVSASHDYDPGPGLGEDPRPAPGGQFSRRPHQSPGTRDPRARDQPRAARPGGRHPASDATYGHGTHTHAAVWKSYLVELLR